MVKLSYKSLVVKRPIVRILKSKLINPLLKKQNNKYEIIQKKLPGQTLTGLSCISFPHTV